MKAAHPLSVRLIGLNYAPELTGIAPYTAKLAHGLAHRGFNVTVTSTYPHYPEWQIPSDWSGSKRQTLESGVRITRLRHYVPENPTGSARALSELSFGLRAVAEPWERPDLAICPSPALLATAVVALRAKFGLRRPALGVVTHDLYSVGAQQTGDYSGSVAFGLRCVEGAVMRAADGVVAIHERVKRRMVADLGIPSASIRVIRNWTHIDSAVTRSRAEVRRKYSWSPGDFVVMHTGAMGEKQNLRTVIDAARLNEHGEHQVRFVLVGDGGQRAALESEAGGLRCLSFVPPVATDEYANLLTGADLLLVNERPGVFDMAVPSKLTSYFSSGRPILAATEAHSATADEISASGAGKTIAPGDAAGLLSAVLAFAQDPDRQQMGARGPKYCARVLSEEAALDSYAEWAEILATRHRLRLAR